MHWLYSIIYYVLSILFILLIIMLSIGSYVCWLFLDCLLHIKRFIYYIFDKNARPYVYLCLLFEIPLLFLTDTGYKYKLNYYIHIIKSTKKVFYVSLSDNGLTCRKIIELSILLLLFMACMCIEGHYDKNYEQFYIFNDSQLNNHFNINKGRIRNNLENFYSSLTIDHIGILSLILAEAYISGAPVLNALIDIIVLVVSYSSFTREAETHIKSLKYNKVYVSRKNSATNNF